MSAWRRELLGPMRQLGYVVGDAEAGAHQWVERFGIGPWRVIHGIGFDSCVYRGQAIELAISIASAYSNGVEIELIAQDDGPRSMYTDHLERHGPGVQHACFFPRDYDQARAHLLDSGMEPVLDGAIAETRFCYLEDAAGQLIEIADVSADGIAAREARGAAADGWDGANPVRVA